MVSIVILNVLIICFHTPDSKAWETYENLNIVFIVFYTGEMTIKMIGLGINNYFRASTYHLLDLLIVTLGICDLVVT